MNLWMLTGGTGGTGVLGDAINTTQLCTLWTKVIDIVEMVIWLLVGVLAIILIIKGVTTALAVVKAADEPQVRQEKLGAFKYLAIGMGVALVIAVLAGTLLSLFGTSMIETAIGGENFTCPTTPVE